MEFGSQASQLVGDLAQAKLEEAQDKRKQAELAQALGDSERAAQLNAQADQLQQDWGDTGTLRLAAHTGGTAGGTGAAVGTLSASAVADALNNAGLDGPLADSLIALASTAVGAATGGTQGGAAAFNEVVNNYLSHEQVDAYVDELESCEARGDCDEIQARYRALSIAQQDELIALCAVDAEACATQYQSLVDDGAHFRDALDGFSGRDIPWQLGLDAGPLLSQYMEAEAIVSQEGFAQYLQEQHGLDIEQASMISAAAAGAVGVIGGKARIGSFRGRYEPNPKHDVNRPGVSPQPTNPERALADSIPVGGNSTSRVAYDSSASEIVMFQNHQGNNYHGYAVTWGDLRQNQKNALINAGLFKPNGKPK